MYMFIPFVYSVVRSGGGLAGQRAPADPGAVEGPHLPAASGALLRDWGGRPSVSARQRLSQGGQYSYIEQKYFQLQLT